MSRVPSIRSLETTHFCARRLRVFLISSDKFDSLSLRRAWWIAKSSSNSSSSGRRLVISWRDSKTLEMCEKGGELEGRTNPPCLKAGGEREDLFFFYFYDRMSKIISFSHLSLNSCLPKVPKRVIVIPIPRGRRRIGI